MKRRFKLEKLTPLLIGTCLLTLVAACGSDDDDSGSGAAPQEEQQQDGQFTVTLAPVGNNVEGTPSGVGGFSISGDDFRAFMTVTGAPTAVHNQHVHIGTRCPSATDDTNQDGFIDIVEATTPSGGALIPLDDDLVSQSAGGDFPRGANYVYDESTSFQAMVQDLRLPDPDPADAVVKLGADDPLNIDGKVVIVHGVPATQELPDTVKGLGSLGPQEALPVLCGVITRVDVGTTTGGTTTGDTTTGTTTGDTTTGDTTTGTTTGDTTTGPGPGPGDCDGTNCPNTTGSMSGI